MSSKLLFLVGHTSTCLIQIARRGGRGVQSCGEVGTACPHGGIERMDRDYTGRLRAVRVTSRPAFAAPRAEADESGGLWETRLYVGTRVTSVPQDTRLKLAQALGGVGVEAEFFVALANTFLQGRRGSHRARRDISAPAGGGRPPTPARGYRARNGDAGLPQRTRRGVSGPRDRERSSGTLVAAVSRLRHTGRAA